MRKPAILLLVLLALIALGWLAVVEHPKPKIHSVTLSWHAPSGGAEVSQMRYNIYRGTSTGGPYAQLATHVSGLSYTDTLVNSGRAYFYVVTAVDSAGRESRYSTEIMAEVP